MVYVGQFYKGSRLLQPISDLIGLPIDQVNFLACNIVALIVGMQFRKHLSPSVYSVKQRLLVEVILGIILVVFCFGYQVVHLLLYSGIPYLMMLYAPRHLYHKLTFLFAMTYICIMHIYRLYYDYGGFSLDVTGPMMIMTQKVTSIAFALHDGECVPEEKLSSDQKEQSTKKVPDPLSYFSYMFYFHGVMCGPLAFYSDYIKFINGENYKIPHPTSNTNNEEGKKYIEPDPSKAITENLLVTAVMGVGMLITPIYFPTSYMADPTFLYGTSFLFRNLYMVISVTMARCKYYFAWKLGEVTNQAAGLGFHGYDEAGNEKWDMINNVDIWKLEMSNSLKVNIDAWNKNTNLWLRRVVYDRVSPKYNTFAVFLVTSFWHGFYPGYYLTFISAAFMTITARNVRRRIRPYFQTSEQKKFFYDCVTFIATRIANPYLVSSFCLLELHASITFLWSIGFYLHILCAVAFVYFTFINRPKKKVE